MRKKSFDVVVIGSGAGGGTVARELSALCRSGRRVLVLESGPRVSESECTGRELEMADKLYADSGGVLTKDRSMTLAFGRAYGGSTVVYTGTSLAMPEEVFARWGVRGITHGDISRRSEKYLIENNVHLLKEDSLNENNRLFRDACRRLGFAVQQFPVNVRGCRGSGLCNLGCPNGAKQGTNRVQLPEAEAAGVEVVTDCHVRVIGERFCDAVVRRRDGGEPPAWEPGEYRIEAPIIVVCAGAASSPALLARSGFADRLPALGRYITLHPALILVGEHEREIAGFRGHPKSFYCDEFWHSDGFLLETCMYFPFTTAKNLIGFGARHSELMRAMPRMQMILVLALDEALAGNRVTLDRDGEPLVDYTLSPRVLDSLHAAMLASARIFFEAGARRVHAPAGRCFFIESSERKDLERLVPRRLVQPGRISISSAHIMGGCRMGENPKDSVTDDRGRVHGAPWLRVADSSLFPRSPEVNPYVTVMALADRVAEGVRDELAELAP